MLSTSQKANILSKAGIIVPLRPERRFAVEHCGISAGRAQPATFEVGAEDQAATLAWQASVENLYTSYVAGRAARSLRESQAAASLTLLRNASWRVDA
jgi:hypothetical protein